MNRAATLAIALLAFWFSTSQVRGQQEDATSAFDKCRLVTVSDLADSKAPKFSAYRVDAPPMAESPKVDLKSNPIAREYRTVLQQESAKGPNFAGHYRVVVWECGSSCAVLAVVNLATGKVLTPDEFESTSTAYFDVDSHSIPGSQSVYTAFGYRRDSRLLVVLGDLNERDRAEGAYYFILENERLRLIHATSVRKNCETVPSPR
jgi:hypothetical protein